MHNSEDNSEENSNDSYPSKGEIIELMEKLKIKVENGELGREEMGILLEDLRYFTTKQGMFIDVETIGCIVAGLWVRKVMANAIPR